MIEMSLAMTMEKPVVFVYDSISRYKNFKPSVQVNTQLLMIGDVLAGSCSFDENLAQCEIDKLYDASEFDRWQPYHMRDPTKMLDPQTSAEVMEEGDRRLPRKPEEVMFKVDENGKHLFSADGTRPLITPELKWLYHYRQYMYNSGSHYVIFEEAAGSAFSMKTNGVAWPEGCVYAHGGNLSYERIQKSLATGTPTVMIYNTGGVAQTFASLHTWCVTRNVDIMDACARTGTDPTRAILARTDIVSSEPWTKKFGISAVAQLQNLVRRAPEEMRKSVVVTDILSGSPEQVVEQLTSCFASGGKGLPELGLGSAETDVVLDAWQAHIVFTSNAKRFRRWGDMLYYFSLLLTMVAAGFAVLITKENYLGKICQKIVEMNQLLELLVILLMNLEVCDS
jgi:hypothetical protein